jgi:orotidine-5'-phosphate decarboxylase
MIPATFNERCEQVLERNGSRLCVGLDTDLRNVPAFLSTADNPVLEFNTRIIEATHDLVSAYKMNLAFYEAAGEAGMHALHRTLDAIPNGIITIGDAKRGDIGNTAERYAQSLLEYFNFDAVTVNPYLGIDSLQPFFKYEGKCVFVLALTSNPGSFDFQRKEIEGKPLYMHVIDRCMQEFRGSGSLGFVVGATHPGELAAIRERVGNDVPLLIPGLGSQGGDAQQAMQANRDGIAFFNVSRAVIHAGSDEDFAARAREAAQRFAEQLGAAAPSTQQSNG